MRTHSLLALSLLATTGSLSCSEAPDRRAVEKNTSSSAQAGKSKTPARKNSNNAKDENADFDVVVVGAGISGLTTALELGRGGARVLVIDMSSVFGGHAVMAHGGLAIVGTPVQEAAGVPDSVDLAERDFLE